MGVRADGKRELSVAEVARMSSYSSRYILHLIKNGEIKARVARDRWAIPREEAEKAVRRKRDTVGCRYIRKKTAPPVSLAPETV